MRVSQGVRAAIAVVVSVLITGLLTAVPGHAATGDTYAWGAGTFGEIGNGVSSNALSPAAVSTPPGITVATIADGGARTTCGLTAGGAAYCWGLGNLGQLGDGGGLSHNSATAVAVTMPAGVTFASITMAQLTQCALSQAGKAFCWGRGEDGELGNNTTVSSDVPVPVSMPNGVSFTQITANRGTFCGLSTAGAVFCWGAGWGGMIGNGVNAAVSVPTAVSGLGGTTVTQLLALFYATCALTSSGTVYCWGSNGSGTGVIGNGTNGSASVPTAVTMPDGGATTFARLYANHQGNTPCALTSLGRAYCWGDGTYGQVGSGVFASANVPTPVAMPEGITFASITQSSNTTCALARASDAAYCWGGNWSGTLGIGTSGADTDVSVPTAVATPGGVTYAGLSGSGWAGSFCGWTPAGSVYCWGAGRSGQVGDGKGVDTSVPTAVPIPGGTPVTGIASQVMTFFALTTAVVTAPGVPRAPVAVAGSGRATVKVLAGAGAAPVSYTVTSTPGSKVCTVTVPATSCVVTGLVNGTSYRFRATATNGGGTSTASALSNAVVPRAAQLPKNACVTAGSATTIARGTWKTLMTAGCATTAGRRVAAKVTAKTSSGAVSSVQLVCVVSGARVTPVTVGSGYVRCASGVLKIAPVTSAKRITVRWYAAGSTTIAPYSKSRTYTT